MNRRRFLTVTAIGASSGVGSLAMPAVAQPMPNIRWRLTTSWPKSLDILHGTCEVFTKRVAEITDNRFQIEVFAAGEIVPGLAVLDAVQNATVEIGHTAAFYYWGKEAALAFGTTVPFGLNARQMESWLTHGGGNDLLQEYSRPSIAMASQWAIRVVRWAVGFARRSIRSMTCRA